MEYKLTTYFNWGFQFKQNRLVGNDFLAFGAKEFYFTFQEVHLFPSLLTFCGQKLLNDFVQIGFVGAGLHL